MMVFCLVIPVSAKTTENGVAVYVSDNEATFDPGGATYSRIICLKNSGSANGTLLCTYDQLKNVTVAMDDGTSVSKQVYPIYKSTDNGDNWQLISNVYDKSDRPGMITVTELPNGKYMATYEMVNRPSLSQNNAVVYCKFSDDGVTWDAGSLGNRVALADGRGIGSSVSFYTA